MRDDFFNHLSESELTFTKEDRDKVFEQINSTENDNSKISFNPLSKRIAYFTASLVAVGLSILLFIPSILSENIHYGENSVTNPNGAIGQKEEFFTTLVAIKDGNQRIPLNLLLSYSKDKNMINVLSIPRDTYISISGNNNGIHDKLTHAYAYSSDGAESVKTTVSNYFDIPIDYYAVFDLETISTVIDSVNGIDYELQEDIRVRAISQATFDLEQGHHSLNGEEVVALMMDATHGGRSMDENDLVNLLDAVMNSVINEMPKTQLTELTSKVEGNIPMERLLEENLELPSIHLVSMIDGMSSVMLDELYFVKFEKEFINSVVKELTTFK